MQDTDRPGYTDIPKRLMAGYMTMAQEAIEEMKEKGVRPTHVFLQAGVGSMAAGVAAYLTNVFKENPPVFVIVEAKAADCLHKTVAAQDGKIHIAEGDLATMMAGLACGEPCRTALSMLEETAENFVTITDRVSARAMRMLGNSCGKVLQRNGARRWGLTKTLLCSVSRPRPTRTKETIGAWCGTACRRATEGLDGAFRMEEGLRRLVRGLFLSGCPSLEGVRLLDFHEEDSKNWRRTISNARVLQTPCLCQMTYDVRNFQHNAQLFSSFRFTSQLRTACALGETVQNG